MDATVGVSEFTRHDLDAEARRMLPPGSKLVQWLIRITNSTTVLKVVFVRNGETGTKTMVL